MTQRERKRLQEREATEGWMIVCFGLFVIFQLLALYVAGCQRGYGNVIIWQGLSFFPLVLSIRAWLRLGREGGER